MSSCSGSDFSLMPEKDASADLRSLKETRVSEVVDSIALQSLTPYSLELALCTDSEVISPFRS